MSTQAAHLQIYISKVMNAGFCDSKCCLMQVLCVVLFVCIVVALREPSMDMVALCRWEERSCSTRFVP